MHFLVLGMMTILAWYFFGYARSLCRNYRNAVRSGLPFIVVPLDDRNMLFQLSQTHLKSILKHILPTSWYDRFRLVVFSWELRDKNEIHEKLGSTFVIVTAASNQVWCADPALAQIILARRKDFVQLPLASKIMGFLGQNILTSNGEVWARQRRIVAPNLNERVSQIIWDESMKQAQDMADFMLRQPGGNSTESLSALRAIAINVLGEVAYGQARPFQPKAIPKDPFTEISYTEAISLCTELLIVAALLPEWLLQLVFMPRAFRMVGVAKRKLPGLTADMLTQERERLASQKNTRDNIMSQLVRFSDQGRIGDAHSIPTGQYLSEDEIAGNLFVFTAAGYDTTANTMGYALGLLAAYPQWQVWIQEEIDVVAANAGGRRSYEVCFPKLQRTLAVMLETLRLFPALLHVTRSVQTDQTVTVRGQTHLIAGPCEVYVSISALNHARSTWGDDARQFRPSRWLTPEGKMTTPARGTFLVWSGGPRVCPGQKMAQVEFVTVFSTLFSRLSVEPAPTANTTIQQARINLLDLMEDSTTRLTLQINEPDKFVLRWIERVTPELE